MQINVHRLTKNIFLAWLALTFCAQGNAANIININVTGNIVAAPCMVDTGSVSQTVDFGQLLGTDLRMAGAASAWQVFQVKVVNCPAATYNATATFSGTPYPGDATLYANAGTADNIAIQVADSVTKTSIKGNGSSMSVNIDVPTHSAIFPLAGRVIAPGGNAGSGTIRSVMQMTFTYQ